jgi:putative component of membrane protein insertase Oxa1/YidC/SpoIIIJ protein YidD
MIAERITAVGRLLLAGGVPHWLDGATTLIAIMVLRVYRLTLSGRIGAVCMFRPSCSEMALQALQIRGWNGSRVAIRARLTRCNGVYTAAHDGTAFEVRTSDGEIVGEAALSEAFTRQLYHNHRERLSR